MPDEPVVEVGTDQPEEAPEPHEMFARTREEGERRLTRSRLELTTTSLVAGFDVVFGVIALAAATVAITPHFGPSAGHFVGSLFFGIAFIFIVVGRSELFTENFLVPITALRRRKLTKLKLAELWTISPVMNLVGGTALVLVVSSKGRPAGGIGAGARRRRRDDRRARLLDGVSERGRRRRPDHRDDLAGRGRRHGRRAGRRRVDRRRDARPALAQPRHRRHARAILGMRFGADISGGDVAVNFLIAVVGNMLGGLLFVTLTRTSQAIGSGATDGPTA
jgi:formate-nitrite transporter family protein